MDSFKSKDSLNGFYQTALLKIMKHLEMHNQVLCTKVNCPVI